MTGERQPGAGWCARLYDEKAASLVLYGRALGLSHSEAEDALQDTFLALLQLAEPPAQPDHYLVRCFRNHALNYRRGLWRRAKRELESWRWFEPADGESPHELEAMRCLARLPAEQREVIVLRLWHEFTFASIGQLLGVSPNTVAGRYRYGLQKLRACLLATQQEALEAEPGGFDSAKRLECAGLPALSDTSQLKAGASSRTPSDSRRRPPHSRFPGLWRHAAWHGG